jgi:putative endonuclease
MRKTLKKYLGDKGERCALQFLKKNNLQFICKNYSCSYGEIDIIMQDRDELVFVEVRYRKNSKFCDPVTTINHAKQLKLYKTAQHYISRYNIKSAMRFDVIGIQPNLPPDWIRNAFAIEQQSW